MGEAFIGVKGHLTRDQRSEVSRALMAGDRILIDIQDPDHSPTAALGFSAMHAASVIRVRHGDGPWTIIKSKEQSNVSMTIIPFTRLDGTDACTCPKCGPPHILPEIQYLPPGSKCIHAVRGADGSDNRVSEEHLHLKCPRCGFIWGMKTMSDAPYPYEYETAMAVGRA